MSQLIFREESLDKLTRHLENTYPFEGVGFMYGLEGENKQIIDVLPVLNSKEGDQRRRFLVDPSDYIKAEDHADKLGLQLLGVYHSHPDHPAEPSEHDRVGALPNFSYVILSVQKGKAKDLSSWQLNQERLFEREQISEEIIKHSEV